MDALLVERKQIARAIEVHVEKDTKGWGLEVTGLRIQDVSMPEELKKMMSRRPLLNARSATITKAEGDREAAVNLAAAAHTMGESPGAMQLRTLQTIDGLGPAASNTVVIAVPVELMELIRGLNESQKFGYSSRAQRQAEFRSAARTAHIGGGHEERGTSLVPRSATSRMGFPFE